MVSVYPMKGPHLREWGHPDTVRGGLAMRGLITTRHLVTNASVIIREFGLGAYVRCLWTALASRRPVTFLEVVMRCASR